MSNKDSGKPQKVLQLPQQADLGRQQAGHGKPV